MAASPWWEKNTGTVEYIKEHIMGTGLMRKGDEGVRLVSATVLPSPFPEELFLQAYRVQQDINSLIVAASRDHDFITSALKSVLKTDSFSKKIFDVYEAARTDNKQTCTLSIIRSDYMVHKTATTSLELKQIEVNTVAASLYGYTSKLRDLHKYFSGRFCPKEPVNLPANNCLLTCVDAIACAWRHYPARQTACVLMVVLPNETVVFEFRLIERELWERHKVAIIFKTLTECSKEALLGPNRELLVAGQEVAVVYYRSGYDPSHYPSEKEWKARILMERSRASLCPSAAQQLVGTKKIQQVLAQPGVLERFLDNPKSVERIRSTFAGLYSLELVSLVVAACSWLRLPLATGHTLSASCQASSKGAAGYFL